MDIRKLILENMTVGDLKQRHYKNAIEYAMQKLNKRVSEIIALDNSAIMQIKNSLKN